MASPHNSTDPKSLSTVLAEVLGELTLAAEKCYDLRRALDAPLQKFNRGQKKQRKMREVTEESLGSARSIGAEIKQRLTDTLSSTPLLPTDDADMIEYAIRRFDSALENIEHQKVAGLLQIIDTAHLDFFRAHGDIESIQNEQARDQLKTALNVLDQALAGFRKSVERNCQGVILDLTKGYTHVPDERQAAPTPAPTTSAASTSLNVTQGTPASRERLRYLKYLKKRAAEYEAAQSAQATPPTPITATLPDESQGSLVSPVSTVDSTVSNPTQFDRSNPPNLSLLSEWLGFGTDSIATALLLNSAEVQASFRQWRSAPGQPTIADQPEKLKLVMVFFTYSRESLVNWSESRLSSHRRADGITFAAAVFAKQVVQYFENSCEDIDWTPVSARHGLDSYDIARRRWAIALQIFWFLEKTYGNTPPPTSGQELTNMLSNMKQLS
ncbi:hypothetical protein F5B22DRAFT_115518 [Xylaria bambusicola]|uniref:uncharacterized protein n=1 Tax=Xylaria bambusicola TaxID=326684 RepID=UPI002007739F|nr:uncharacterized protein F5B22DRAFT_115518 [Xylaria bambusicola]KAI0517271.1 hypothetical protein F5B22DRAFT_115518 [Xylaria bambusicola]